LHYHHKDVYVCPCGYRSKSYWGLVNTHHKTCDKGSLEQEYKMIEQTVITVEHVNSESQQVKAENEKIAKEKWEEKTNERNEKLAVSK